MGQLLAFSCRLPTCGVWYPSRAGLAAQTAERWARSSSATAAKDNAGAGRIAAWLKEKGHQSPFLDFDPQNGIPAGRDWEKELHNRLRGCRAVIALLSERFTRIGPCELPQMPHSFQAIDLTIDPDDGFRRLARGLAQAGLDPKDIFQWDSSRPPDPGLMAFQQTDVPVFFGRDRLHNLRRYGGRPLVLEPFRPSEEPDRAEERRADPLRE